MPQPKPRYEYRIVYPSEDRLSEYGVLGWRVVPGIIVYGEASWQNQLLMERETNASVV